MRIPYKPSIHELSGRASLFIIDPSSFRFAFRHYEFRVSNLLIPRAHTMSKLDEQLTHPHFQPKNQRVSTARALDTLPKNCQGGYSPDKGVRIMATAHLNL